MDPRDIERYINDIDPLELIRRFDIEFDVPLRHGWAIGILRMQQAFDPVAEGADDNAMVLHVGAHWCDIIRADVLYEAIEGLHLVDRSRAAADRLHGIVDEDPKRNALATYVMARWLDSAGKIAYRVGDYARARMKFEAALDIARRGDVWWCWPDIESNLLRASLEEFDQVVNGTSAWRHDWAGMDADEGARERALEWVQERTEQLEKARSDYERIAAERSTSWRQRLPDGLHEREFLRGVCSVLHNLSVAQKRLSGMVADTLAQTRLRTESLAASAASYDIAKRMDDGYRQAQALNHQALLTSGDEQLEKYEKMGKLRWARGGRIARQNLAGAEGGIEGAKKLRALLHEIEQDSDVAGRDAGLDIEVLRYTLDRYAAVLASVDEQEWPDRRNEISSLRLRVARSIRQIVALPAYKRAHNTTARPTYLSAIGQALAAPSGGGTAWEDALSLAEESSARELLDLMASTAIHRLDDPPAPATEPPPEAVYARSEVSGRRRRRALRSAGAQEWHKGVLTQRQEEFEKQFLRTPLKATAHDGDIAHRLSMFTTNNLDTCVVRYTTYRSDDGSEQLGALVVRGGRGHIVTDLHIDDVKQLIRELPTDEAPGFRHSADIWELLIAPLWDVAVGDVGQPGHLILIPTAGLFVVPFHLARPPDDDAMPLGAMLPLAGAVSATTLVTRGRHLLRRQRVSDDDDLAALIIGDESVSGDEVAIANWPASHLHIAGDAPDGVADHFHSHKADWAGLRALSDTRPEFFVYAGHGEYDAAYGDLGPFLHILRDDSTRDDLTSYDVALRVRLPRNRLSVIGACLAGQGAETAGGDVAGFLRAFIAAGAGALAMPLWAVDDKAMATTVGHLLRASRTTTDGIYDVVHVLHDHYRSIAAEGDPDETERMPLALYL